MLCEVNGHVTHQLEIDHRLGAQPAPTSKLKLVNLVRLISSKINIVCQCRQGLGNLKPFSKVRYDDRVIGKRDVVINKNLNAM